MPQGPLRNPRDFYREVDTATPINKRLRIFIEEYRRHRGRISRRANVLDIGCGPRAYLSGHLEEGDLYSGCDIAELHPDTNVHRFEMVDLNEESLARRFKNEQFDVVFCGEVIEHLFSPDALLRDIGKILAPDAIVILSTPNIGYWVNRFLLIGGISPLFLENSSQMKLGRRSRVFGQGNITEGHIRLFTFRALEEFVELNGFKAIRKTAAPVWRTYVDDLVCKIAPSLGPDLIFVIRQSPS